MKLDGCDCWSTTNTDGKTPAVIILNPFTQKEIAIDCCIAGEIASLLSHGIRTFCSCCGHNEKGPSVAVHVTDLIRAAEHLFRIDPNRRWLVMAWSESIPEARLWLQCGKLLDTWVGIKKEPQ